MTPVSDGNTPLSPEELADLLPSLSTREELNEWERENILRAREWSIRDRTRPRDMVSDAYVRKLHRKMFDQTWKWAGRYRQSDKNIGIPLLEIRESLAALFGDARYWIENRTFSPDETAVRFHHRLGAVHPFPNGNGRHARLIADALVIKFSRATFTWGAANPTQPGEARARYLEALRMADKGELEPLLGFARS
jgi:Fic-DOC domain mobile mystery protein B